MFFSESPGASAVAFVISGERFHRERAGTVRVDRRRRADAVLPHHRAEPRNQRRQLFRSRMRAREQRVLQHAARRRIDDDGDAIDRRGRRMGLQIEQRQRAQRAHVAHRRRQLEPPRVDLACDQPQITCRTAAPRSRRSRRVESGSSSRVSTNDNGSSPSIGHSSSSEKSNRSSSSVGISGRTSSPRAIACHTAPHGRAARQGRRRAAPPARRASESPSVSPRRSQSSQSFWDRKCSARVRGLAWPRALSRECQSRSARARPLLRRVDDGEAGTRLREDHGRVRVPATATCTRMPRSAAARRSSSPIVCAGPSSRVRPLTSIDTRSSRSISNRGEKSCAIADRPTACVRRRYAATPRPGGR